MLSVSQVTFGELSEAQIAAYVATGEPMGKAGAYASQGGGEAFIRHLSGSYSGVMGVPLFETTALLEGFGIAVGYSRPDAPSPHPSPESGRGGVGDVREERAGTTRWWLRGVVSDARGERKGVVWGMSGFISVERGG